MSIRYLIVVLVCLNVFALTAQDGKWTGSISCCSCNPCKNFSSEQDYNNHVCSVHGVGCSVSGNSNNYNGPNFWDLINRAKESKVSKADKLHHKEMEDAYNLNNQGIEYQKTGDWTNAVACYEKALKLSPDDDVIRNNLDQARYALNRQLEDQKKEQQEKESAKNMNQSLNNYVQSLKTTQSTSGSLDFDGRNAGNSPNAGDSKSGLDFIAAGATPSKVTSTTKTNELEFGDPKVVDARNVPSELAKETEHAIDGAYKNAPAGVTERVRKAFQAVETKNWEVAKVWFKDALKLDPDNKELKTLIQLCDYPPIKDQKTNNPQETIEEIRIKHPIHSQKPDPYFEMNQTDKYEIDAFFKQVLIEGKTSIKPNIKVKKYLDNISLEDFVYHGTVQMPEKDDAQFLLLDDLIPDNLPLPNENDILFLFPGNY